MAGPNNPQEALSWIREAAREGRFVATRHVIDRGCMRNAPLIDVIAAIRRATQIEPYGAASEHGGTCWRVHGQDTSGRRLAIGVEAYLDKNKRWAVLITVIDTSRRTT